MPLSYSQDINHRLQREALLVKSPDLARALLAEGRAQGLAEALRVFREHQKTHRRIKAQRG